MFKLRNEGWIMCTRKSFFKYVDSLLDEHPFEIGLSVALSFFGLRSLIVGLNAVPSSVQALPLVLIVVYCILSVLGGCAVLFGLAARYKYLWAYGVERGGLFISASAWASYIIGILFTPITPASTLFILALLALSYGCLRRAKAIKKRVEALTRGLEMAKTNQETE